jgi:hypothetical protein
LGSKARSAHAHLNGCFAHPVESITTCLCWWALVDQVTQDRCRGQNSKVYIVERL